MPSLDTADKEWRAEMDVDALKRVAEIQRDPARKKAALALIQENHENLNVAEGTLSLRRTPGAQRSKKRTNNNGRTY